MLRHKPILKYNGLTIILSNPSRFDKIRLLSGPAGILVNEYLQPEFNLMQCDVRLMEDVSPLLLDTKCLLLLGEAAMHSWCEQETGNNTLNEMRGSPLEYNGIPAIASYFPQDCTDFKNYEQTLNESSKEYNTDEANVDEDDEGDVKRFSPTKRSNYAFWLKADMARCKLILKDGLHYHRSLYKIPTYKIYPSAQEVIDVLTKTKNTIIDLDIETDYEEQNLLCFSFMVDDTVCYCVPVLNEEYKWAYSHLHYIMRALCVACKNNTIVCHNGASFDFLVLGYKYHIPVLHPYDTMLLMHRCFPDIEKSLGHCTSLFTWEKFHKDTDSKSYHTREHMISKLKYCGKDVFTMRLIRKAIESYKTTIPGLTESIKCAQDSILPYVVTMLQGIRYDTVKLAELSKESDQLMMQYLRVIHLLIGEEGIKSCRAVLKGNKPKAFPSSNPQCCEYFHHLLGYPPLARSQKTGEPSLAAKHMYRLALKHSDNPVIQMVLAYRQTKLESARFKTTPWKNDNNEIYKEPIISESNSGFALLA